MDAAGVGRGDTRLVDVVRRDDTEEMRVVVWELRMDEERRSVELAPLTAPVREEEVYR